MLMLLAVPDILSIVHEPSIYSLTIPVVPFSNRCLTTNHHHHFNIYFDRLLCRLDLCFRLLSCLHFTLCGTRAVRSFSLQMCSCWRFHPT